ncbi:MAG: helix-turn-helix transcriptional regulator [Candidatus Gastranaerophilales bacterium]|nr:helix-turn-helix transcriptional regulator [Candidatus Gastranaerophilales bacterium]
MESTKKLLGLRIKELRKAKKLSQFQLAEIIDTDSKHLCRVENGGSYPSFDLLEKISIALNVELKEFFIFSHLQNKDSVITEVDNLMKDSDEKQLQLIYKLIKNVIL